MPMPSSKDLHLAVLDTENQDYGGLDNFDEEENIVLIDDEDNELHQEPCA